MVGAGGSCPSGGQGHAQQNFNLLVCWCVGLCSHPVGCLGWGNPALETTVCLVRLMVASRRAHTNWYFSELLLPVSLSPQWAPATPPTSAGYPSILAGRSGPVSSGVTAFIPWVLVHLRLCVHPSRVDSLFPPVCGSQTPLAFKARFSGDSSSLCQTPRLGSLRWGSELSLLWDNFCGIIVFHFVGHRLSRHGIWVYCDYIPSTVLLGPPLCLWM